MEILDNFQIEWFISTYRVVCSIDADVNISLKKDLFHYIFPRFSLNIQHLLCIAVTLLCAWRCWFSFHHSHICASKLRFWECSVVKIWKNIKWRKISNLEKYQMKKKIKKDGHHLFHRTCSWQTKWHQGCPNSSWIWLKLFAHVNRSACNSIPILQNRIFTLKCENKILSSTFQATINFNELAEDVVNPMVSAHPTTTISQFLLKDNVIFGSILNTCFAPPQFSIDVKRALYPFWSWNCNGKLIKLRKTIMKNFTEFCKHFSRISYD